MMRASDGVIDECDFIVPVPLHKKRLISRRYNQSALLCKSLAKYSNKKTVLDLLRRHKNTPPQATLTTKQRRKNVSSAFKFNRKYDQHITGKTILLIDDVMTTGATIDACTKILLQNGAKKVNVLTIARTTKG